MTTKEMIEVMQAFNEGKTIQYKSPDAFKWIDMGFSIWNFEQYVYRIKPEEKQPEYRPYKDIDEMIEDFKMRINKNQPAHSMPLIWVKSKKKSDFKCLITSFNSTIVNVDGSWSQSMGMLFDLFTYLDGSPCGKLVE